MRTSDSKIDCAALVDELIELMSAIEEVEADAGKMLGPDLRARLGELAKHLKSIQDRATHL